MKKRSEIKLAFDVLWYEDKNDDIIVYKKTAAKYYKIATPGGKHTFRLINQELHYVDIIKILQCEYANSDSKQIEKDITEFLVFLHKKQIIVV